MLRIALTLLAGIVFAGGGAVWFNRALDSSFARGVAAGQSEVEAAYRQETDRQRAAADAALVRSNQEAVALEADRNVLREKLDELVTAAGRSADAGRACLDVDIVRALRATGIQSGAGGARP